MARVNFSFMTGIVAVIFIGGWVAFYFWTKHQSEKEHLEGKIKKLEKENHWAKINEQTRKSKDLKIEEKKDEDEYPDFGYTSIEDYNTAIDEIIKDAKHSPLERLYYEAELPDQLSNEVPLKVKTKEHLDYLIRKGVDNRDVEASREIIQSIENRANKNLDFEGFVKATIDFKGEFITKEIYEGLIKIYEVSGRTLEMSSLTVYNKVFEDLPF